MQLYIRTLPLRPTGTLLNKFTQSASCLLQPCLVSYAWVKGHQDNTATELSIEAQYNVKADHLAGTVRFHPSAPGSNIYLLPSEKCRLVIAGKGIYGQHTSEIRKAYTLPDFHAYLKNRHQWNQDTLQDIDWEAYTQAARNTSIGSVQLMKLVHKKLPTRYELAKANRHADPTCHYCSKPETFTHLLQCHNPVSQEFRNSFHTQLEQYLIRINASDNFSCIILNALDYWMREPETHSIGPRDEQAVFKAQESIGWSLFPKGFFSTQWRHLYESTRNPLIDTTPQSSVDIISGIIQLLWKSQLSLWEKLQLEIGDLRTSHSVRTFEQHSEYVRRVRLLHNQKEFCLHAHKDQYFHDDMETFVCNATVTQLKDYLRQYEPAIHQSVKDAKKISLRPLFTFQGFTRRSEATTHKTTPRTLPVTNSSDSSLNNSTSMGPLFHTSTLAGKPHQTWSGVYATFSCHPQIRENLHTPPNQSPIPSPSP